MTDNDRKNPAPGERERFGFVGLVGLPNAGKSTLCNALVGADLAIVTHKVQTTRVPVRGLFTEKATQVVLVDTPGIMQPKRSLERALVKAAWAAAAEVDRLAFIVDSTRVKREETESLIHQLAALDLPLDIILNKIDRIDKPKLLTLVSWISACAPFENVFLVSAKKGKGIDKIRATWADCLPEGPWHYPQNQIVDAPLPFLAAEMTRKQLFLTMHAELPYQISVVGEGWQTDKKGAVSIHQVIFVARESHRRMILGKDGQALKRVGAQARKEISDFLATPVHLFLHVKVRENWIDNPEIYGQVGLDFGGET